MTIDNTSNPVNHIPLLREEVERTLRLRAWKDETFRQALIADPKDVVQRLFPHYLPDGKDCQQLTYKVIQEDQFTHHIVLPALPYEVLTPVTNNASDFIRQLPPLREEVERTLRLRAWKDEAFRQELIADPQGVTERLFPQCFLDGKAPEQLTYIVIEEDPSTHYIVLPALPDQFLTFEVPEEEQLELIACMSHLESGLSLGNNCNAGDSDNCVLNNERDEARSRLRRKRQEGEHNSGESEPKRKRIDVTRDLLKRRDGEDQGSKPEGSKPESEYSYGREDKRRRTH